MLSELHLRQDFLTNGYIVLRSFFSDEEVGHALREIRRVSQDVGGPADEDTGRMHFYHNLYRHSTTLQAFCSQPRLVDLFTALIGPSFWIRWDHALLKNPGGEEYPWHQDNAYSALKDASLQLWVALTDVDDKTGALQLQKGSHLKGHQPHKPFLRRHIVCESKIGEEVSLHAKAGDVIVFSSMILHRSGPNRSSVPRWVYIAEYMDRRHYDPTISPPYFMVARRGKPDSRFVSTFRGKLNPVNRLRYYRYSPVVQKVRHAGRVAIDAILRKSRG